MEISTVSAMISLAFALLGAAGVYGTDVFFCVVGRAALTRVSDSALVETMGRFHEVADRRMPMFGVIGIGGALASIAFSGVSWPWALSAVAAQVLGIVVYRSVAAPVNAELTRHARAGSVAADARAPQARWDGVIVLRVLLMASRWSRSLLHSFGRRSEVPLKGLTMNEPRSRRSSIRWRRLSDRASQLSWARGGG